MKLHDKVAVITGGAGGLGTAMTKELSKHGAKIAMVDLNEKVLFDSVHKLKEEGYNVMGIVGNVLEKASVQNVMKAVMEEWGSIDILVNNAGGSLNTPKNLEEIEEEDWDLVLNVNLRGAFFCSQAAVPYMKRKNQGSIINIASIGARTASPVTGVAYAAAKGGIISFSRRLALEVGKNHIRVNTIAPGLVISGNRMQGMWDDLSETEQKSVFEGIPLNRLGEIEEQAKVVSFLASDESSYMTGAVIDVNGGRYMG